MFLAVFAPSRKAQSDFPLGVLLLKENSGKFPFFTRKSAALNFSILDSCTIA
jgi:hypothetical protein